MANSITVYGIANCDTVKKAKKWLDSQSMDYEFHDYKKLGIDAGTLKDWCKQFGWEAVLNRRGTTWRKLDDNQKTDINEARAIALMVEHTSMIKRPVIVKGRKRLLGFNESSYESELL